MPNNYIFRLNNFQIFNTMAAHNDTDYVYFTVKVGDQMLGPRHAKIGDLNNGTYPLNWEFGPVPLDDNTPVLLTYQIVNHGHDDDAKQLQDDIKIANTIAQAVGGIVGAVFPEVAVVIEIIAGAIKDIGDALGWVFGQINCDGMVLSDAISTRGDTIRGWMTPVGLHTEIRSYTGPNTPVGCGSNARYAVSWSITPSYARIDNRNSGLSMDVADASLLDGAPVNQFTTHNGANQRWRLIPVGAVKTPHPVAIVSVNSGKALDVPNGSCDSGTFMQQYTLHEGPNQLWLFNPSPDNGSVHIVNMNSNLALDIPGFSTIPGTGIQQYQPNDGANQQWFIVPDPVDP